MKQISKLGAGAGQRTQIMAGHSNAVDIAGTARWNISPERINISYGCLETPHSCRVVTKKKERK